MEVCSPTCFGTQALALVLIGRNLGPEGQPAPGGRASAERRGDEAAPARSRYTAAYGDPPRSTRRADESDS